MNDNASLLIRLPAVFFDDHNERELPCPAVARRTGRHIWVRRNDPALPELLDDAQHYAHPDGPDMLPAGLKASAIATVKAILS